MTKEEVGNLKSGGPEIRGVRDSSSDRNGETMLGRTSG